MTQRRVGKPVSPAPQNSANNGWKFLQSFGEPPIATPNPEDIISALNFDPSGDMIGVGDQGGRIVLFQRVPQDEVKVKRGVEYRFYFEFHSHDSMFDPLFSEEVTSAVHTVLWLPKQANSQTLITANEKHIKLWRLQHKDHSTSAVIPPSETNLARLRHHEQFLQNTASVRGSQPQKQFTLSDLHLPTRARSRPNPAVPNQPVSAKLRRVFPGRGPHYTGAFSGTGVSEILGIKGIPLGEGHPPNMPSPFACLPSHLHSVKLMGDQETLLTADEFGITLWNIEYAHTCMNTLYLPPEAFRAPSSLSGAANPHTPTPTSIPSQEDLLNSQVSGSPLSLALLVSRMMTAAEAHPHNASLVSWTLGDGLPHLTDLRDDAHHLRGKCYQLGPETYPPLPQSLMGSEARHYLSFSPDGQYLALRNTSTVRVWDVRNEKAPLWTQCVPPRVSYATDERFRICWSPSSRHLMTGSLSNMFCTYNTPSGELASSCEAAFPRRKGAPRLPANPAQRIVNCAWHPNDPRVLALATRTNLFFYYGTQGPSPPSQPETHTQQPHVKQTVGVQPR
eukprot:gnl/Trimastix_PCT/4321.p1 GENE.gnl/Trimastix_PCT/4321~~gnl/Trimastix_PCT/4321.p1  ORF type:complete len:562 (+),score=64.51 gnl/Trimastix_PCT/4321:34-1719(+)